MDRMLGGSTETAATSKDGLRWGNWLLRARSRLCASGHCPTLMTPTSALWQFHAPARHPLPDCDNINGLAMHVLEAGFGPRADHVSCFSTASRSLHIAGGGSCCLWRLRDIT
jgi:hypothetical protein